ncbi:NAP1-related protein 2 [Hibiscus syriacus]|uniref:NAP1-related protein 2 n=1 Tax=Hibiscus syriacus TaxID=106335 RepID=A0A6A2WIY1_HIBSY|nr:NAP1-related protein 2 [Hibiscus syriacus]
MVTHLLHDSLECVTVLNSVPWDTTVIFTMSILIIPLEVMGIGSKCSISFLGSLESCLEVLDGTTAVDFELEIITPLLTWLMLLISASISLIGGGYFRILCHIAEINEEASKNVLEVEKKYNEIRKPIYDKRKEKIKSIPDFWLTAFLSHRALGELLNEEDRKIFKYISSLEVKDFKDLKYGYSITTSIPIHTLKIRSLQRPLPSLMKDPRLLPPKSSEKKACFFTWFTDAQQKDDMDEIHDEVAKIIKEDLWPNPLAYFNTVTSSDDFDFDGDEEGDGTNYVFSVTVLTVRDLVVLDFGFDGLPG